MAVDSNVIIYERVREERRQGRSLVQSLDAGFQRALATIVDANFTTLIAAIILFYLGSGPVRGFAVTLAIGIVTTVFTAFTLTRWMIVALAAPQPADELPAGLVNYRSGRYRSSASCACAITPSRFRRSLRLPRAVLFMAVDMNYGIDFRGGSLDRSAGASRATPTSGAVRAALEELNLGDVQVQEFGSPRDLLIRIGDAGGRRQRRAVCAHQGQSRARRRLRLPPHRGRSGRPSRRELAWAGTIGVLASLAGDADLYLVPVRMAVRRGRDHRHAARRAHDGRASSSWFRHRVQPDQSIAAILTIVGYSINDTVVVYDRVRENLRKYKKMPIEHCSTCR